MGPAGDFLEFSKVQSKNILNSNKLSRIQPSQDAEKKHVGETTHRVRDGPGAFFCPHPTGLPTKRHFKRMAMMSVFDAGPRPEAEHIGKSSHGIVDMYPDRHRPSYILR